MKNVNMELQGKKLVITVDLTEEHGPSSTGKTIVVATTSGSVPVPGYEHIKIGLNVYKKPA